MTETTTTDPDTTAGSQGGGTAPEPAKAPSVKLDREGRELQLLEVKAKSRQAIAEANAATLKAGLYEAQSKPKTTGTTVDEKAGSMVDVAAARALEAVAEHFSKTIDEHLEDGSVVLIVEHRRLAETDAPYADIRARFTWFNEEFDRWIGDLEPSAAQTTPPAQTADDDVRQVMFALPIAAGITSAIQIGSAAMSLVGLGADLVGMFKTNYAISGRDVALDQASFSALMARGLNHRNITVIVDGFVPLAESVLIRSFNELRTKRNKLESIVAQGRARDVGPTQRLIDRYLSRIEAAEAEFDKAVSGGKPFGDKARLVNKLRDELAGIETAEFLDVRARLDNATVLVSSLDQYLTLITTVPEGQTYPPIVAAAIREPLHLGIGSGDSPAKVTHVLYAGLVASGGDVATESNHFKKDDWITVVGSARATFTLVDTRGAVVCASARGEVMGGKYDFGDMEMRWQQ